MLYTSIFSSVIFSALFASVSAHSRCVNPNVASTVQRSNVLTSNTCTPSIATSIGAAVQADSTGSFTVSCVNFNGGTDGATAQKTAQADVTGTGNSFSTTVTITKNGNANPSSTETDTVIMKLPAGTTCPAGGCLVKTVSDGGFTSCFAVLTSGSSGSTGATTTTTSVAKTSAATTTTTATTKSAVTTTAASGTTTSNNAEETVTVTVTVCAASSTAKARRDFFELPAHRRMEKHPQSFVERY